MSDQPRAELATLFQAQQAAFARDSSPSLAIRLDRLEKLRCLLTQNEDRIATAISADFGHRSRHETAIAEVFIVLGGIAHTRKHLKRWMATRRVTTSFHSLPGSSWITPQPLGVVGIVSPWNYPLQLALAPAVEALAAGNRVLIKPSELTPRFSELLAQLIQQHFASDECAVVTGDADLAREFVRLPFDHLFFTGSTAVGRQVGMAAAANLTPVTLELGGKSPVIIDLDCDLEEAARKIAAGKLLNAGQTCIAPDYALVPADRLDAFAQALVRAARRLYPTLAGNDDYTSIINPRHQARLQGLVEDAQARGARILPTHAAEEGLATTRKMTPVLLLDVTDEMSVMQEEIFGPVLPLLPYQNLDEAIGYVKAHPRPLALYWFGNNIAHRDQVLRETISGGVTLNDTLYHVAQDNLPFGGVGPSGSGAYHGETGFRLFSHNKPVFAQSRFSGARLLQPPYGKVADRMVRILKKLV
ncbi:MAG: coniferyl aldehyde dehydrogenase [Hylemonella sp.]|nr:coniferyl aldehyde dehydrogenase [Hylemonella sp.]MDP1937809.1 coniferyl aldehyde dehydrogenase [Hylemonella sp.]